MAFMYLATDQMKYLCIQNYLHFVSALVDAAAAAALAMFFRLLSRKVFDEISFVGLKRLGLPSSDNKPNGLIGGTPPGIEFGDKKLLCIENPDRPPLPFSPPREDACKCGA